MRISLTQMNIVWENKEENKRICERLTAEAAEHGARIVVFPEMTLTGFTMNTAYAGEEKLEGGETVDFFEALSAKYGIAIVFGMVFSEKGIAYNKAIMADGRKMLFDYSKIHPFSYGGETEYYSKGNKIVSAEFGGMKLGSFVCYDLRFPEIFQASSAKNALIFVIANWPKARIDHWNTLLKARAIENQSFIIGVNRTGEGNGILYTPSSAAYSPYGELLTESTDSELLFVDIDEKQPDRYRREFPVKEDRQPQLYKDIII